MGVPLRAFRVGVVGARRARQGTGPFLASFLAAAGARVVAVCGTSEATAAEAAKGLAERFGIAATPYADPDAMIARDRLDALVIASPAETHLGWLERALAARLHVLCEKPFVFGDGDFAGDAARLVPAFSTAGLCLHVAAQWRFALAAYMQLFPDVNPRAARGFTMGLSPTTEGASVLPDAMPHPLSLLDHLYPAPDEDLRDVTFDVRSPGDMTVRFIHPGRGGVACDVRLVTSRTQPRPLSFGFDGQVAHREVREPGYRFFLKAGVAPASREVPLPDPLEALAKHFVATVRKGPPFPADATIVPGSRRLSQLVRAWHAGAGHVGGGQGPA